MLASLACGVCTALVLSAVIVHQWRAPAHVLSEYSGTRIGGQATVGQTFYSDFGLDAGSAHPTITLRSVDLRVVSNTADASILLVRCTWKPGQPGVGSTIAPPTLCAKGDPVVSSPITVAPNVQVLYRITPRKPGEVVIEGGDVRYQYGHRSGRQHVGVAVSLGVY